MDQELCYKKENYDETGEKVEVLLRVPFTKAEQKRVIRCVHEGLGNSVESQSMRGHGGVTAMTNILKRTFYWHTMDSDIKEYCKLCCMCQKVNNKWMQEKPPLQNVPLPKAISLLLLALDYFSKWTEGEPLKDKTEVSIASFLFKLIFRHSCVKIQINDQGKEFVNSVSIELHRLTRIHHRLTSAYHLQANSLVERQNGRIKNKLQVLQGKPEGWSRCLELLLFAHRSTKMTPFFLMYGRQSILPVDFSNHLDGSDMTDNDSNFVYGNDEEEIIVFNEDEVTKMMEMMINMKEKAFDTVFNNIKLTPATGHFLTVQSIHRPRKKRSLHIKPATLERINGEGNCFFRHRISKLDSHISHMMTKTEELKNYVKNVEEHLGRRATDVELFSAASLLNIDIML
ncbi:unnamed protein product [Lepeophtheirus salmonis]|uniref:(salmon louse) hypothetical protein n=1 Tax=Lepeophtheirus salmonis TaxID=72036 RepID=A0A7R8H986_LEPSM|nr:unnamed protein product [Lepeophtheirus salmonis]CAF2954753.1 unnamed protein product [Lepeophtheirus salmonis]